MYISTGYFYFKKSQNRKSACQREARKGFDFQSSTEVLQRKNNFPSSDILHANYKDYQPAGLSMKFYQPLVNFTSPGEIHDISEEIEILWDFPWEVTLKSPPGWLFTAFGVATCWRYFIQNTVMLPITKV